MEQTLDYFLIGLLVIGFILGFKDGLIKKVVSLAGFVLGIIGAISFSPLVRVKLLELFNLSPSIAIILSFLIVFLTIILFTKLIIKLIRPKFSVFGFFDRLFGGILGLFQTGLILSGLLIILNIFDIPEEKEKSNYRYYAFIYNLLPDTFRFLENLTPETKQTIEFLEKEIRKNRERINK